MDNKPGYTHNHRWNFLSSKTNFVPTDIMDENMERLYRFVEYAFLICNGPGHEPIVVKTRIELLDEIELANGK